MGEHKAVVAKATDKTLNEVVLYGGLPMTRANVYRVALADLKDVKAADYIAFGPGYPVADVGTPSMTIEEFRQTMDSGRLPKGWSHRVTRKRGKVVAVRLTKS